MVLTGLRKSLKKHNVLDKSFKIEKSLLWDILKKAWNLPQKSLNSFESVLNKNNLCEKKVFCGHERLKAQKYANFLSDHDIVFSYAFNVPGIVHYPLFAAP